MVVDTLSSQIRETLSSIRNASQVVSICCMRQLICDEGEASPGPERGVTEEVYQQLHQLDRHYLHLHTYCPECFEQFLDQMKVA